MMQVISKYIPNVEATVEVTAGSVDNCKLIQTGKAELALIMADIGNIFGDDLHHSPSQGVINSASPPGSHGEAHALGLSLP